MNEEFFDEIYRLYYHRIHAYCYSKTADRDAAVSLANDTFLLLYQKWDSLDFTNMPDACSLWLFEVAKRKTLAFLRKNPRRFVIENLEMHQDTLPDPDTASEVQNTEEAYEQSLDRIRHRLKRKDAVLFDWLVMQKMSQSEAADQLGISVDALKMRWHRVKPKIRSIIADMKEEGLL